MFIHTEGVGVFCISLLLNYYYYELLGRLDLGLYISDTFTIVQRILTSVRLRSSLIHLGFCGSHTRDPWGQISLYTLQILKANLILAKLINHDLQVSKCKLDCGVCRFYLELKDFPRTLRTGGNWRASSKTQNKF